MSTVFWDVETFSRCDLGKRGASIYAADPSTGVFFFCYAVDDGEVQVWRPGDPVPAPFANPTEYMFVADNWTFEDQILVHVLIPRHGFKPIARTQQDCAQRLALASAFPADLGRRCEALNLPYRKDPAAGAAMLRLSRLQEYKDPAKRERDLELLLQRCKTDVESTRAAFNHPRLRPLPPEERHLLLIDAEINARGICANVPFLEAVFALATAERDAINARFVELTAGAITSVDQVERIREAVNARGHELKTLGKRSVAAALAHKPDNHSRELLGLRQRGAHNSAAKRLLNFTDPGDHRIRDALRFCGGATGRWSSLGAQLHNLARNDAEHPASLIDAILAGDRAELTRYGNPIEVVGQLTRAALCAASEHELICADFGAIESRVLAWIAGETWKLENFRHFDATGDKNLDLYRILARVILLKNTSINEITAAERQLGKCAEIACGFGGSVGAWRKIAGDEDVRSDAEVQTIVRAWRGKHPRTRTFWYRLADAARLSIRNRQAIRVMPAPRPSIVTNFDGTDLTITLPSGRAINYPGAHLIPNTKFEDGEPDIEFMDNARGQWKPARAWYGVLVENVVQGIARDLLAAAIIRAEARGWQVVFLCHDELVVEAPIGAIPERDVLALLLDPPAWAAGLPLGGKVHSGALYLEAPTAADPPIARVETGPPIEPAGDDRARAQRESPRFSNDFDEAPETAHTGEIIVENATAEAAPIAAAIVDAEPPPPPSSPPPSEASSGNGRGDGFSGFTTETDYSGNFDSFTADADRGGNGARRGDGSKTETERDTYTAEHADEPFDDAYLRENYRLTWIFNFMLPDGTLLYQHNRYELREGIRPTKKRPRKRFLTHRKVGGVEVFGAGDRRVIYNWPAIMHAAPGSFIFVPEGENKAEKLITVGLLATTVLSHKWTPECVAALTGHHLIILADHDKDGEKLAADAQRKLASIAASIRNVPAAHLWKHLPGGVEPKPHDDVADWIKLGGDPGKLIEICREIPVAGTIVLDSVCAADEEIEDYDWVWFGRFALKKIGLLVGLPDEGKGLAISDIMARITRGAPWPCGEGCAPLGSAILLSAEDDVRDTIVPRLMAAGADLKRVHIITMAHEKDSERMFSLITDLPALRQKVGEVGDVKLVVIDPVSAYLGIGKVDSFRATDVRAILGPLKMLAEELRILILGIMHFNKKTDVTNLLLRISDSLAYGAASRHVYGVINDEDNQRKLFVKGKNNLAPREQKTLAFGFDEREVGTDKRTGLPICRPYIVWHPEPVDITATEALQAAAESKSPSARDDAKHFIEMLLSNGPVISKDVQEAVKENGISKRTLDRARKALGARIEIKKDGPPNEKGEITWRWHLDAKTGGEN
jgi:DNA polymerase